MLKPFIIGLAFLAVAGCAIEPSYRAKYIRPAYPEMVTDCVFLGGVTASSDLSYTPLGKQRAKFMALDEAAQLGATHIVWIDLSQGPRPTAKGRAYRCEEGTFNNRSLDFHYPDGEVHDYSIYNESRDSQEVFYTK